MLGEGVGDWTSDTPRGKNKSGRDSRGRILLSHAWCHLARRSLDSHGGAAALYRRLTFTVVPFGLPPTSAYALNEPLNEPSFAL